MYAFAHVVGVDRRRRRDQIREPSVYRLVQGPRLAGKAQVADGRRERRRRHRHVGRQPRAGRRLSRDAPGHRLDHRHARGHAPGEGTEHAEIGRARRLRGRNHRRGGDPRARHGGRRGLDLRPPLRRSEGHRRPGHGGARNARRLPGSRHPGRADRRRWVDLGQRHRGQGHQSRHRNHRRRGGNVPVDVSGRERPDAAGRRAHDRRRHRRQERSAR